MRSRLVVEPRFNHPIQSLLASFVPALLAAACTDKPNAALSRMDATTPVATMQQAPTGSTSSPPSMASANSPAPAVVVTAAAVPASSGLDPAPVDDGPTRAAPSEEMETSNETFPSAVDSGLPDPAASVINDAGAIESDVDAGMVPAEEPPFPALPDPGTDGDGDYEAGPNYEAQPELSDLGAPQGQRFQFTLPLAESAIFDGRDATLDPAKPVNQNRVISVYIPDQYEDGTPAPVLVIQDGDGPLGMVSNALDNLTLADDDSRRLPPFVAVAVQNGGSDAQGSERGLEYDTMSDRYARFIDEEVLPAVAANSAVRAAYPKFAFTRDPSGRGALGCSSGAAAAFTMAWFRSDLFSRVIAYSTTLVDQQDYDAPERDTYPHGAWDYHSELELIASAEKKPIRVFLNVNENDLRANDPESTFHNWVMANDRTAAALAEKGYHYRYIYGLGAGHCDARVQQATLADALVWVWRGYEPANE